MPGKPHHKILVYRQSVWLSAWDLSTGTPTWMVYPRPRVRRGRGQRPWWSGLRRPKSVQIPSPQVRPPLLIAYAYTEWTSDTPKRPNGTDLWVPTADPDTWAVYYSRHNWDSCLLSSDDEWVYCYDVEWVDWVA